MKKSSSIVKSKNGSIKDTIKGSLRKTKHSLKKEFANQLSNEDAKHNFVTSSKIKPKKMHKDIESGVQNLESLKLMLQDATKNRLTNENNFEKVLDNGMVLVSRIRTQSKLDSEIAEDHFGDEGSYKQDTDSFTSDGSPIKSNKDFESYELPQYNQPLLNSKKRLSSLLIQASPSSKDQKEMSPSKNNESISVEEKGLDYKNEIRGSFREEKAIFDPPLPKKNSIKLVRNYNINKRKVRETDPVLSRSKLMAEKKSLKELERFREVVPLKSKRKTINLNKASS